MYWLIIQSVLEVMQNAYATGSAPTAAQVEAMAVRGGGELQLTVKNGHVTIPVEGVLTNRPDFFAMIFGGGNTTYPSLIAALAKAQSDPDVKSASLQIDSPGGQLDGLFDALAAIEAFSKPLTADVRGTAASAAYALAAKTDKIVARNIASRVGSIGIAVEMRVDPDRYAITSTAAPKKRPDVKTAEGQAVVREELDAYHEIFADAIASGRGTTVAKVNADFGQGATLLAGEALKRGMIDQIAGVSANSGKTATTTTADGGQQPEENPMDLQTLKASHPAVYAAAVAEGQTAERKRVSAHLKMAQSYNDMPTAMAAIEAGDDLDATHIAAYLTADKNRQSVSDRANDDTSASDAADISADAAAESVDDLVCAQLGYSGA